VRRAGLFTSRTLAIVAVSLFALIGCCLLAWWQWTRFESASGTLQNLGYVLQWPLFGLFPGFMFYRIHQAGQAEKAKAAVNAADGEVTAPKPRAEQPERPQPAEKPHEVDKPQAQKSGDWPDELTYVQNRAVDHSDEDPVLAQYNSYLAALSAQEHHNDR
jgi:DNA-binding transcriptional regulator of glucitol operon